MESLTGEQLLTAWELSRTLPEHEAALSLLTLARPEALDARSGTLAFERAQRLAA